MAYSFYVKNTAVPGRIADRFKGTYTLLLNKYRVDEIYNYIFVDGLVHKLAKFLHTVGDVKIIDGFINGLADAIGNTSVRGKKIPDRVCAAVCLQHGPRACGAGRVVLRSK